MALPIFLLTDFGTADPFVGIMKAVMNTISPKSQLIDLTHEILPGEIRSGAVALWQSLPYLPEKSVILLVVDPGVGTNRRPILLQTKGFSFIGPDNGVFSYILEEDYQVWEVINSNLTLSRTGATFHGRDIFAPAAAHVANGTPANSFGPPINDLVLLSPPQLSWSGKRRLVGEIIHIDRFGNLLTSLGQFNPKDEEKYCFCPWIGNHEQSEVNLENAQIQLPDQKIIKWAQTFAKIPKNQCRFILGSSNLIEIAANQESAAKELNLAINDPITLLF